MGGHFILKPNLGRQRVSHTPCMAMIIRTEGVGLDASGIH
jgi:hypothetical protein